jgi:hypothetical protein
LRSAIGRAGDALERTGWASGLPRSRTPARDDGRAVAYQDVLTVPPETNKDNHEVVALNPSSPSTPPAYPHMLILSAVE